MICSRFTRARWKLARRLLSLILRNKKVTLPLVGMVPKSLAERLFAVSSVRSTSTTEQAVRLESCATTVEAPVDWSPDGTKLVLSAPGRGISIMALDTGQRSAILPGSSAVFSPDGRWLAVDTGSVWASCRVAIFPFSEHGDIAQNDPILVGNPAFSNLFPSWSPGGELLYFITTPYFNAPYAVLHAQRFNPDTGKLDGQPFLVYRFERPFLPFLVASHFNRLAVSPGQIVLALERSGKGDVWTLELKAGK
jgi:hypothetical protein